MPIIYTRLQYREGSETFRKISVKGYRSIFRGTVTGESTIDMLWRIKRSRGLKFMKTLEFDPYFCELSGLQQLAQVLNKFKKTLVSLNVVIRRMELEDKMDRLGSYLPKLMSLKKLRIELPHTQRIVTNDVKILMKGCRKCYLLKSIEVHLIGLSNLPIGKSCILRSCYSCA